MISKEDKIKKESSVSRQLQQQVPKTTLDGTYNKHNNVTQFDTADRIIAEDLNEEFIPVVEIIYKDEIISTISKSSKIIELAPSSQLTEYNKIKVDIDKEGHLFYFDWTEKNKRIHLRHPAGTYWTIDDDGNYNFKVIKDYDKIVKGTENAVINLGQNVVIKKDRKVSIKETDYVSIGKKRNVSIGTSLGTVIGASEYRNIGGRRVTIIDNEEIVKINKYKDQTIKGQYSVTSKDFIAFRAPLLVFDVGKLEFRSKSSIIEKTSGKREIQSEKLVLSGMDGLSLSTTGDFSQTVVGFSEEIVTGLPGSDSKNITVNAGNFNVSTIAGSITLESTLPLSVSMSNSLGSIEVNTTGDVDFTSPLADISIKATGDIELNGTAGSIKISLSDTTIEGPMVKLGSSSATEGVVLLSQLRVWLNRHTHPSSMGPTGPPSSPATESLGSTKIFVE